MAAHDPPSDALLGRVLAQRYEVESLIARGGMARVYRARDRRLARPVALKVLSPPYADDREFVERFLAEARTAASFSHPNLAHVYDSGSDGATHFMALELLDRHRSLREELRRRHRLPPDEAVAVISEVLEGLAPLHTRGLVHCDIKAGNVMVGGGATKLIDFGIARPLREARAEPTSIGSLHVMSPEQLRGEELTPASDLFAVGVVLYEALTGQVPYRGETPEEVATAHRRGEVTSPSELAPEVGPGLAAAVLEALEREPEKRFASAEAMRNALRAAHRADGAEADAADEETTTLLVAQPRTRRPARAQRRPGRARGVVAILALLAAPALVVGLVLSGLSDPDRSGGPAGTTPTLAQSTPTLAPGTLRVPDTIGMSEVDGEAAARAAGLNWRIEWVVDPAQAPGIHDQEPPPGTVVRAGSRFVMYAYRSD